MERAGCRVRKRMSNSVDLERVRVEFAERLRDVAGLRSSALVRALATVPREHFVGPGPWEILNPSDLPRDYRLTPDDDPRRLYDTVLVALAEPVNGNETVGSGI